MNRSSSADGATALIGLVPFLTDRRQFEFSLDVFLRGAEAART